MPPGPWRYLAASDRAAIWVTLQQQTVTALWIAEDGIDRANTTSPLGDGAINIGLPSDAIIAALCATRPDAVTAWLDYLHTRRWTRTRPSTYPAAMAEVSARYQVAARLWAMRAIARSDGHLTDAAAYLTLLRVEAQRWALA